MVERATARAPAGVVDVDELAPAGGSIEAFWLVAGGAGVLLDEPAHIGQPAARP